jgi:hypothetical protein
VLDNGSYEERLETDLSGGIEINLILGILGNGE